MANEIKILGIHIIDRQKESGQVQKVLTEYGCSIRTRLGLHEVSDNHCSTSGLVLIELFGDKAKQDKLEDALINVEGIDIQKMIF